MADQKISQLTDGTSFQAGDEAVVNRSGTNFKVDPTQFGSSIDVTGTVTADGADLDGAVVINESGADVDFRVESDTNTHALFVQGSDGNVGIGTSSPTNYSGRSTVALAGSTNTGLLDFVNNSGSQAYVYGDANGSFVIQARDTSSANTQIRINSDGSSGIITLHTNNNTERLRITSAGNVGIGTSSPNEALDVNGTVTADGLTVSSGGTFTNQNGVTLNLERNDTNLGDGDFISGLRFGNNDSSGTPPHGTGIKVTADSTFGAMFLDILSGSRDAWDNSAKAIRVSDAKTSFYQPVVFNEDGGDNDFRVESDTNTHMLFVDAGNNRVGINQSSPATTLDVVGSIGVSGGVYLGGTAAANLLDDYEEGTWTPEVADAATGGNVAAGGSFSAYYTKVGRQVTVTVFGLNIDTTGMTGANTLYIRGFPFTSNATASDYGTVRAQNVAYQSGASIAVQLAGNSTYANIIENITNASTGLVSVSDIASATGDILFTMTYTAA